MELRRQFAMKREHIIRNHGETTAPQGKGYGQIQVPKGKRSKQIQSPNRQPMIKMVAQDDVTKANLQTMQKAMTQYEVTSARQQPIKKTAGENGTSGPSKQTMKRTVVGTEGLRENQHLKKRAVAENDCARPKHQLMKKAVAGNDCARPKQQPMKKAVAENNCARPKQQTMKKAVAENDCTRPKQQPKKSVMAENESLRVNQQDKYIIPDKGQKAIFSRINDAWRSYKSKFKKKHYEKYSTLKERLKNRPMTIPETHFKQLMAYWGNSTIQNISKKNDINRAKQKYAHRTGPINFARIRAKLLEKKNDGEEVTQAEMFIETHKSRKGKEVDEQTQFAILNLIWFACSLFWFFAGWVYLVLEKLQDSIHDSNESAKQAFESLFGKEKSGRVRCYGRTATPSQLKRNEEIKALKKQHSIELNSCINRSQGMEALLRCVLKQNNPTLDDEVIDIMIANAIANENSATMPHSSTSTHTPNIEKVITEDEDHFEDVEEE
ncbi:putative transposase, Ptta/En/Spm, plant [Sesbania bispinosa]|nr:putative transposase, Ptta/En/Spm, plant [Sesbania bispinosa]